MLAALRSFPPPIGMEDDALFSDFNSGLGVCSHGCCQGFSKPWFEVEQLVEAGAGLGVGRLLGQRMLAGCRRAGQILPCQLKPRLSQ